MPFPGLKIWNKSSSNIKTAATTASFMHGLKKFLINCKSEQFYLFSWQLLAFLLLYFFVFIPLGAP